MSLTIRNTTKRDGHFIPGFPATGAGYTTKAKARAAAKASGNDIMTPIKVSNRFWSGWAIGVESDWAVWVFEHGSDTAMRIERAQ